MYVYDLRFFLSPWVNFRWHITRGFEVSWARRAGREKFLQTKCSKELRGRILDPQGRPLDGSGHLAVADRRRKEGRKRAEICVLPGFKCVFSLNGWSYKSRMMTNEFYLKSKAAAISHVYFHGKLHISRRQVQEDSSEVCQCRRKWRWETCLWFPSQSRCLPVGLKLRCGFVWKETQHFDGESAFSPIFHSHHWCTPFPETPVTSCNNINSMNRNFLHLVISLANGSKLLKQPFVHNFARARRDRWTDLRAMNQQSTSGPCDVNVMSFKMSHWNIVKLRKMLERLSALFPGCACFRSFRFPTMAEQRLGKEIFRSFPSHRTNKDWTMSTFCSVHVGCDAGCHRCAC